MKKYIAMVFSWVLSIAAFLFFLSLFFYPLATLLFPYAVSFSYALKEPRSIAAFQYTKKHRLPQDYVAIFGDSYAFGQGDAMYRLQTEYRPDFNVTQFLYRDMGVDMVSFGIPSSGSLKSYVKNPDSQFHYLEESYFGSFQKPAYIVLYFYEGNDIEENVVEAKEGFQSKDIENSSSVPSVFIDMQRMMNFIMHSVMFIFNIDNNYDGFKMLDGSEAPEGKINRAWINGKNVAISDGLQGPSMLLGDEGVEIGFNILERSVSYVKTRYPGVPVILVDIPSPATVYQFSSDEIDLWDLLGISEGASRRPASGIRPRSNRFCQRAMDIANRQGVAFHDARPGIVDHGKTMLLHGPVDWHHFNLQGYQVLTVEIKKSVTALMTGDKTNLQTCVEIQ